MTTYLPDAAMIALCDFIVDSDALCHALNLLPCPFAGYVESYQIEFELGARLDLWPERSRQVIEAGMLEMAINEALFDYSEQTVSNSSTTDCYN